MKAAQDSKSGTLQKLHFEVTPYPQEPVFVSFHAGVRVLLPVTAAFVTRSCFQIQVGLHDVMELQKCVCVHVPNVLHVHSKAE